MNYQAQKTFSVCTAHRLMDHPGACRNLHGHNYNITVHIGADSLNAAGMVVDFGDIKRSIGALINDLYDHKTVLQFTDPMVAMWQEPFNDTLLLMNCAPTAENMARDVFARCNNMLQECDFEGVAVVQVDVEETANSIATYKE